MLACGALGGLVNAMMSDNGFALPKKETLQNGGTLVRPGYLSNVFIGAVAALISWGLYGPLSAFRIFGSAPALETVDPKQVYLSLAAVVGAVLVGVGGAKWLSDEVDKKLLRATAVQAASRGASTESSSKIALVTPAQALEVAKAMK